jgi:hypothetical protein
VLFLERGQASTQRGNRAKGRLGIVELRRAARQILGAVRRGGAFTSV